MVDRKTLAVAGMLAFASLAPSVTHAEVRRERTLRRPYVIEIGQPYRVSTATIDAESRRTSELNDYLVEYGYPDYAEIQEITPEWPWESYEVRLFYLRRNVEVDFGHVVGIDVPSPDFGVMKFQGGIPAQKRHEIEVALEAKEPAPVIEPAVVASSAPAEARMETLVARVEAAAERAAQAADKATEQSEAAERAANRTVSIVEKMSAAPTHRAKRR